MLDRLIGLVVLVVFGAVAVAAAAPAITTLMVVGTVCLVVLGAAWHYMGPR
jgi:hypothetical protein